MRHRKVIQHLLPFVFVNTKGLTAFKFLHHLPPIHLFSCILSHTHPHQPPNSPPPIFHYTQTSLLAVSCMQHSSLTSLLCTSVPCGPIHHGNIFWNVVLPTHHLLVESLVSFKTQLRCCLLHKTSPHKWHSLLLEITFLLLCMYHVFTYLWKSLYLSNRI